MLFDLLAAQCPLEPVEDYAAMVIDASQEFNVDPRILNSVVVQETRCNHSAVGAQGEIGLVQLHPQVWSHPYNWNMLSSALGWEHLNEALDPFQNLRAGAWLLGLNKALSNGDLHGALSRYNGSSAYADEVLLRYEMYWQGCEL